MSGRWFRFYEGALDDPKVQQLPARLFKAWVNILCVASKAAGVLPDCAKLAFSLRETEKSTDEIVAKLAAAGLLDITESGPTPHNWNGRQYQSDVSNERVKRHRERRRNAECNVTDAVTETPSESEQNQSRTEQKESSSLRSDESAPRRSKQTSATRIPENWRPNDAGRSFAADRGMDPDSTADAFTDYWAANNGRTATKRDWNAAFRTWCRRADADRAVGANSTRTVPATRGHDAYFEQLALIASRDRNDDNRRK
jgi:hypothetical protein